MNDSEIPDLSKVSQLQANYVVQLMKEIAEIKAMLVTLLQLQRGAVEGDIETKLAIERAKYQKAMQVFNEQVLKLWDPEVDE